MRSDIMNLFLSMKSEEYECAITDFTSSENTVFCTADKEDVFKMATIGKGAVVITTEKIRRDVSAFFSRHGGIFCFDAPQLCVLNELLQKHGCTLGELYDTFLPFAVSTTEIPGPPDLRIAKLSNRDIERLEHRDQFENALCSTDTKSRDEFAYAAFDGAEIVSIAGTSSNTEHFWSVGVDTKEEYRNRGLATHLTSLVSREVLERGKYPMYSTWYANIGSRTIAINSGYRPACVEIAAERER
jgi:hypothetical protein